MSLRRADPEGGWAAWCGTVLDLPPTAAAQVAGDLRAFAATLPPTARGAMAAGLATLDAASLATTGRRFASLEPRRRAEVAGRLPDDLVAAMKVPVLLVHGASEATPKLLAAANRTPPARPDATLDVTASGAWPSRSVADVVVVGSGAGGAMAARTLARSGMATVVLEEGRRHGVEEFRRTPALERFTSLYRDGGATVALGRPPVYLPIGRGVGGTTLVNSGTCYRPPASVVADWRQGSGVDLPAEAFDEVEALLRVAPVPDAVMGRNGQLALAGARALGWSSRPLHRNAPGCGGCCQCALGCPRNAKFGVHLNALPDACAAGARVVSHARVERVLHAGGRVAGVRARRPDGSVLEILAPAVVVCAGATETPPLLRRSGLGRHPQLGRNLAVHPALSVAGRFDEVVDPDRGVLQSAAIEELHHAEGIIIEATATPAGLGSMLLPGIGAELRQELAAAPHLAHLGAMVADAPAGRVRGGRRAVVGYDLTRADGAKLVRAVWAMGRVLFAAGAREVLTGVPGHERVRTEADLEDAVAHANPRHLHLAAFHPTGTARLGADAQAAPVDPEGRLRGAEGLWVADASVVPTCPEVNPQVAIMALALSIASHLVAARAS